MTVRLGDLRMSRCDCQQLWLVMHEIPYSDVYGGTDGNTYRWVLLLGKFGKGCNPLGVGCRAIRRVPPLPAGTFLHSHLEYIEKLELNA